MYQKSAQSAMERCDTAALKRVVWPITQLVSNPPPLPPVTPSLSGIHPAARDQVVHARHQILVVVARIMILDDVAEILAVGGAAARIRIQHHVALGRHPLDFVIEGVAVGCVRAAVNVEDHRILLAFLKIRRTLHPGLDALAVEALVPDHYRLGEIQLGEQFVVDVGQAAHLARRRRPGHIQIADVGGRRNQYRGLGRVRRRTVCEDIVIAVGDRFDLSGLGVHALQVRAAFFGRSDVNEAAILAPERFRRPVAAWRALIAAHAAARYRSRNSR